MARTDYGPEIKSSMGGAVGRKAPPGKRLPSANAPAKKVAPEQDNPAEMAQDKQRGIAPGSPQDLAMDARGAGAGPSQQVPRPPTPGGGGANPAHAMMAASIAHAILGGSKGGSY